MEGGPIDLQAILDDIANVLRLRPINDSERRNLVDDYLEADEWELSIEELIAALRYVDRKHLSMQVRDRMARLVQVPNVGGAHVRAWQELEQQVIAAEDGESAKR